MKTNYPRMAQFICDAIMLDEWNVELLTVEEAYKYIDKAYLYDDYNEAQTIEDVLHEGHGELILGDWELIMLNGELLIVDYSRDLKVEIPNKVGVQVENILIDALNKLTREREDAEQDVKAMEETYNELNQWSR